MIFDDFQPFLIIVFKRVKMSCLNFFLFCASFEPGISVVAKNFEITMRCDISNVAMAFENNKEKIYVQEMIPIEKKDKMPQNGFISSAQIVASVSSKDSATGAASKNEESRNEQMESIYGAAGENSNSQQISGRR